MFENRPPDPLHDKVNDNKCREELDKSPLNVVPEARMVEDLLGRIIESCFDCEAIIDTVPSICPGKESFRGRDTGREVPAVKVLLKELFERRETG